MGKIKKKASIISKRGMTEFKQKSPSVVSKTEKTIKAAEKGLKSRIQRGVSKIATKEEAKRIGKKIKKIVTSKEAKSIGKSVGNFLKNWGAATRKIHEQGGILKPTKRK